MKLNQLLNEIINGSKKDGVDNGEEHLIQEAIKQASDDMFDNYKRKTIKAALKQISASGEQCLKSENLKSGQMSIFQDEDLLGNIAVMEDDKEKSYVSVGSLNAKQLRSKYMRQAKNITNAVMQNQQYADQIIPIADYCEAHECDFEAAVKKLNRYESEKVTPISKAG